MIGNKCASFVSEHSLEIGSLGLDCTPGVGTAKSAGEFFTGKDLVTGAETSRCMALVGVIPFAKAFTKGGKALANSKVLDKIYDVSSGIFGNSTGAKIGAGLPSVIRSEASISTNLAKAGAGKQIWSANGTRSSVENALHHWNKHGREFTELQNSKQYVEKAWIFLKSTSKDIFSKTRPNGKLLRYNQNTNVFGSYTKDGVPKTMFRPKNGIQYWDMQ